MSDSFVISAMTWTEIDEAAKERPVALLPIGSTQAHGPHLTVSADAVVAMELARRGALKLKEHRIPALVLPTLGYSVSELGVGFAGTLGLSPETVQAVLRDICLAAAKKFRAVVLVNVNLDGRQVDALKKTVEEVKKAGMSVCYTDFLKKRWADMLGETFIVGEHAGAYETSLVMAAGSGHVREAVRRSLAPVDGVHDALKKGAQTLMDAGSEDAYTGDPTAASAEDGETYFETLAEILALTAMEQLGSKA